MSKNFLKLISVPLVWMSVVASANPEVSHLREQRACILKLGSLAATYELFQASWLSNKDSKYNVERNLSELQKQHSEYANSVTQFVAQFDSSFLLSRGTFSEAAAELDKRYAQTIASVDRTLIADDVFMYSVNSITNGLSQLSNEIASINSATCIHTPSVQQAEILNDNVRPWIAKMKETSAYVAAAKQKRLRVLDVALESLKASLAGAWSQKTTQDLASIRNTIDGIFRAESILRECREWYANFAVNSETTKLANQYLQFEEPLRRMRIALLKGSRYSVAIAKLDLPPQTREEALRQVRAYVSTLQSSIENHQTLGWRGLLARQKLLNEKRRELRGRLSAACLKEIDAYESVASKVETLSEFRLAEKQYRVLYNACLVARGRP
jgi:hypothetical protein